MDEKVQFYECNTFTYEINARPGLRFLIKKVVRKLVYWLIKPIGDRQNYFNQQTMDILLALLEENKGQKREIEALNLKLEDMKAENRNILDHQKNELTEEISRLHIVLNDQIDKYKQHNDITCDNIIRKLDYGMRGGISCNCHDIDVMHDESLRGHILQLARQGESSCEDMNELSEIFQRSVEHELTKRENREVIVVICAGLKLQYGMEAIRNEAYALYVLLSKWSKYEIRMISIEEQPEIERHGAVIYIPENQMEKYFSGMHIKLLVLMEADISFVFRARGLFLKYKTIVRLAGQNPLAGVEEACFEQLRYLNDLNLQRYYVYSENAKKLLENAGFKNVKLTNPFIHADQWKLQADAVRRKNIIGFASSPMEAGYLAQRGIDLMTQMMVTASELEFHVLWRNEALEAPPQWRGLVNCKLYFGKQDMHQFYRTIGILLIPYASIEHNHACSVSALEAMAQGIPVVATQIAGVSDWIEQFGTGEICRADSEDLYRGIRKVQDQYQWYAAKEKTLLFRQKLSEPNTIHEIEHYAETYQPEVIETLGEWKRDLGYAGKELVKEPDNIKSYYSRIEIAENYHADRFLKYPLNCIDLLERTSIRNIINDRFGRHDLRLLDIASGDGRIMQEDLKYGVCLGVDTSAAMLEEMEKRFQDKKI